MVLKSVQKYLYVAHSVRAAQQLFLFIYAWLGIHSFAHLLSPRLLKISNHERFRVGHCVLFHSVHSILFRSF